MMMMMMMNISTRGGVFLGRFLHFQDLWELHAESSVKIRVARRDYEVRSYNRDLKSGSAFL